MKIKTKYNVGDLVLIRDEETRAFRIIGILVEVLMSGYTSITYTARGLERELHDRVKSVTIDKFPEKAIVGHAKEVPSSNPLAQAAKQKKKSKE